MDKKILCGSESSKYALEVVSEDIKICDNCKYFKGVKNEHI